MPTISPSRSLIPIEARRRERAVARRCRRFALPCGDQGLLIHRALYEAVGGRAPIPLMAEVEVVRRLGRRRIAAMRAVAITSAERWRREGWRRRNLAVLALWFPGVSPARPARLCARPVSPSAGSR